MKRFAAAIVMTWETLGLKANIVVLTVEMILALVVLVGVVS